MEGWIKNICIICSLIWEDYLKYLAYAIKNFNMVIDVTDNYNHENMVIASNKK